MSGTANVCDAVAGFNDWSRPWEFPTHVAASLAAEDGELFQAIWAEATDAKHWTLANLAACAEGVQFALAARFPELDAATVTAIANAAAYQWR